MVDDKMMLVSRLTGTHAEIQKTVAGVDLDIQIYKDTGGDWRIRDILGHIATWDREITKSLKAFLEKSEYVIAGIEEDESDFNELAVAEQLNLTKDQIVSEWENARKEFIDTIRDIPSSLFPGDLFYPWGSERGSITKLVEYMIEHDEEHNAEIKKAINKI